MDWTNGFGRVSFTLCYKILISLLPRRWWSVPMNVKAQQLLQQLCPCHLRMMSCQNTWLNYLKIKPVQPAVILSLVGPHAWKRLAQLSDPLPPPLQVFFNVKTPGTQLYAIVRTGKGNHAQFNNYSTLQEHLEELTPSQSKSKVWFKVWDWMNDWFLVLYVKLCLSDLPNPALSLWSNICYPAWSTSATSRCGYLHE